MRSFSLDKTNLISVSVKETIVNNLCISDISNIMVFPGFTDVHVHLREPGFSYKETILTGSKAASRGGYTTVCAMPNLKPVPDSIQHIQEQLNIIGKDAVIRVLPYASITVEEKGERLSDISALSKYAVAFSDDGRGVQDRGLMREAMQEIKKTGKVLAAHCEDNSLLMGGVIHKGTYAKEHNIPGICSESEWKQIERDVELASLTGVKYHVCHISTKESVNIIREAKKSGVDVTCETGPHYLLLDDSNLIEHGNFKMNPPLRDKKDKEALLEGLCDGTVDMIATDHAPHSQEEKSQGLLKSPMGIVGLETAFPLLYTYLVKKGIITLEKLIDLMCYAPEKRFDIINENRGYSVWDMGQEYNINPNEFLSMGRNTPFAGTKVTGCCLLTQMGDNTVYALTK